MNTLRDATKWLLRANGVFLFSIFLLLSLSQEVSAFSWFKDYKAKNAYVKKDYNKVREILEKAQVDNPNDAHLNYNLGTVYYKLNQLEKAKFSFDRAVNNCSEKQNQLKEISLFNLGNSLYKNCLQILPIDWEKKEIEQQLLDAAINEAQGAAQRYKNALTIDKDNNRTKVNLKKAEELLKKLQDKKQKQQQQNKQDKQKDQKQDKQDQQQNQQQQQSKDQQCQQDKQQSQQDKEQQQSAEKNDKNKENQQQNQEGQQGAQQGADKKNDGTDNKSQEQKTSDKDKGISQESTHEKDSQKKEQQTAQPEENGTKEGQEKQGQAAFGQEGQEDGLKERGFRVILDDLQSDESKMQKMVIKQKSKEQEKLLDSKQKPW